ncbi:MAG: methyltransferase domain-containing protein, partial [Anaerolineae bacterium]
RMIQALLDLDDQYRSLQSRYAELEADRAARLENLQRLERLLAEAERDRAARLGVIEAQGAEIARLQAEVHRWLEENKALWQQVGEMEAERNRLQAQLANLQRRLDESEAQRSRQAALGVAQQEQLQAVMAQLRTLQGLFTAIQRGRVYRVVRRLGGWKWVEQALLSARQPDPSLKVGLDIGWECPSCEVPNHVTVSQMVDNLNPEAAFVAIREPKKWGGVLFTDGAEDRIVRRLERLGIVVQEYAVDVADYSRYFMAARYREDFPNYYPFNLPEKVLEHYLAAVLLQLTEQDIYIDIASEHSPAPDIYHRLYGVKAYRQDLCYPPGLNGDMIGGDAANMPVPDGFATKMALHCSFEHFEGNSDIGFIREAARVLRPGGAVCIVPLYLFEEYAIQTDPVVAVLAGLAFEDDAIVYTLQGWGNRHGRFYDPEHFVSRVYNNLGKMTAEIYRITNVQQIDPSCYLRFALLIKKPLGC